MSTRVTSVCTPSEVPTIGAGQSSRRAGPAGNTAGFMPAGHNKKTGAKNAIAVQDSLQPQGLRRETKCWQPPSNSCSHICHANNCCVHVYDWCMHTTTQQINHNGFCSESRRRSIRNKRLLPPPPGLVWQALELVEQTSSESDVGLARFKPREGGSGGSDVFEHA